jgi:hypothetical protein
MSLKERNARQNENEVRQREMVFFVPKGSRVLDRGLEREGCFFGPSVVWWTTYGTDGMAAGTND